MLVTSKPWYESVTLWVNALTIVAAALAAIADQAGVLQLPPQAAAYVGIALAVVNVALRVLRTNQPVAGTPAETALVKVAVKRRLTAD